MPASDAVAVEARVVTRPVRQLMKGRCVVAADVLELCLGRQLDEIPHRLIERVIAVAMLNPRPTGDQ
ncbi:hypothetical protein D3C75_1204440 [compost metagenome]